MKTGNRKHQVLFYNYNMALNESLPGDLTLVNSPASCLQNATRHTYDLIVICQQFKSLKERFALIELCSILKKNPGTMQVPLLCLLSARHRELLEQLQKAGVEYARFCDLCGPISKNSLEFLLATPDEDCRTDRILSGICPHINYFSISQDQEIMYCGAYRNRLVLGPYRLSHSCETFNHKNCQYFKCPKFD